MLSVFSFLFFFGGGELAISETIRFKINFVCCALFALRKFETVRFLTIFLT